MGFTRHNHILHCDGVDLRQIAQTHGTPTYVYSSSLIEQKWKAYQQALAPVKSMACYAVKANSSLGVLSLLASLGAGFDAVSGGEILRVLQAGGQANKIVFSGVGKTTWEIAFALQVGIHCFNVESPAELERINAIATQLHKKARIAIRVNPDVDAHVDEHVATGIGDSKFGISLQEVIPTYLHAKALPMIDIVGMSCHIGSQIAQADPYLETLDVLEPLILELRRQGIELEHLDIGGGAGIRYHEGETPLPPSDFIPQVLARIQQFDPEQKLTIVVEPGRSIVAESGVLLCQVQYLKQGQFGKTFAIVDASMSELIRPTLYNAYHGISVVEQTTDTTYEAINIVGPVCESSDWLGLDRQLAVQAGDLLVIECAGAYGASMASNYNSRVLPTEVMVQNKQVHVLRKQSLQDMLGLETPLGQPVNSHDIEQLYQVLEQAQSLKI